MSIAALVILAFVVLHKSQYFGRQRHFCGPVPSYRQGGARLQQRPPQSRRRLHCVKSLPTPVRRLSNPPTSTVANRLGTGGTAATLFTGQCAQPTGPIALSPKRGRNVEPHTQAHTHTSATPAHCPTHCRSFEP